MGTPIEKIIYAVECPNRVDPLYLFERKADAEEFADAVRQWGTEAFVTDQPILTAKTAVAVIEDEMGTTAEEDK